jgi:hypothetical protein
MYFVTFIAFIIISVLFRYHVIKRKKWDEETIIHAVKVVRS